MASFTIAAEGRRCTVKLTPMQPLSVAVDQAREKLKLTGQATPTLKHGKTVLDLNTPIRFANIPAGAKLDLDTGASARLGIPPSSSHASEQPATSALGAAAAATALLSAPAASSGQSHHELPEDPHAASSSAAQAATNDAVYPAGSRHVTTEADMSLLPTAVPSHPQDQNAAALQSQLALPAQHTQPSASQPSSSNAAAVQLMAQPQPSTSSTAVRGLHPMQQQQDQQPARDSCMTHTISQQPVTAASSSKGGGHPSLGLGSSKGVQSIPARQRNIKVFSRIAAEQQEAAASSATSNDPPPEFYEFTAEDYHTVMAGKHSAHQEAAFMKTEKMRAAEERAAAAKLGPVLLRVYFPGDVVVQVEFGALEPLSRLKDLVKEWLIPGLQSWQLFTTPPKQVIKDWSATFYSAHLIPAAHIHWTGPTSDDSPCLRPEILALMADPPPKAVRLAHEQMGASAGNGAAGDIREEKLRQQRQQQAGGRAEEGSAKKVPKWLKR